MRTSVLVSLVGIIVILTTIVVLTVENYILLPSLLVISTLLLVWGLPKLFWGLIDFYLEAHRPEHLKLERANPVRLRRSINWTAFYISIFPNLIAALAFIAGIYKAEHIATLITPLFISEYGDGVWVFGLAQGVAYVSVLLNAYVLHFVACLITLPFSIYLERYYERINRTKPHKLWTDL